MVNTGVNPLLKKALIIMGCTSSILQQAGGKRKKMLIPEVVVFVPTMQIPVQSDLQKGLKGLIPKDMIDHLIHFRNRAILLSEDTGLYFVYTVFILKLNTCTILRRFDHGFYADVSAIPEIKQALEEYLPVLLGLTKKGLIKSCCS